MKKFDIEKAKNGAAVCLEDGTPVKILDFDFNGDILYKVKVTQDSGRTLDGTIVVDQQGVRRENGYDGKNLNLYMATVYGYTVLYKTDDEKLIGSIIHYEKITAEKEMLEQKENKYVKVFCLAKVELLDE